ncbi:hypothetical protein [Altererythrobacter sp. Root672]|uniref:hypothetical protein n=1 Tax=Altererythrobacter sp. Root672 TaxID=1736584 RepID=UPI000AC7BE74|nr:hypothetical protein [Altererythrobacter sp. Root672]
MTGRLALSAFVAAFAAVSVSAQAGFTALFDGSTLDGWAPVGGAEWSCKKTW